MKENFYGKTPSINNHSFLDYPSQDDCLTIFFTGCTHNCKDCQNPELQRVGIVYDKLSFKEFVTTLKDVAFRLRTTKIVLQGGDPMHDQNRLFTKQLMDELHTEYDFCVYTGYDYDQVKNYTTNAKFVKAGLFKIDKFVTPEKTDTYMQFASTNQELYKNNQIVTENGRYYFER